MISISSAGHLAISNMIIIIQKCETCVTIMIDWPSLVSKWQFRCIINETKCINSRKKKRKMHILLLFKSLARFKTAVFASDCSINLYSIPHSSTTTTTTTKRNSWTAYSVIYSMFLTNYPIFPYLRIPTVFLIFIWMCVRLLFGKYFFFPFVYSVLIYVPKLIMTT